MVPVSRIVLRFTGYNTDWMYFYSSLISRDMNIIRHQYMWHMLRNDNVDDNIAFFVVSTNLNCKDEIGF